MKNIDLSEVGAGFNNSTLGSQESFRCALKALSQPGQRVALEIEIDHPTVAHQSSCAVMLSLLEPGTLLWLSPGLRNTAVAPWIVFHTNCQITANPKNAEFAWIKSWSEVPLLEEFSVGSDEYPDQSTTCIIETSEYSQRQESRLQLVLTGPGIQTSTLVKGLAIPEEQLKTFATQWANNHRQFPRGVDVLLTVPQALYGLPRTTSLALQAEESLCTLP